MSRALPHSLSRLALVMALPMALAACEPTWQGTAPVVKGSAAASQCGAGVTVYSGDTVYSIARRCGVTVRELIEANDLQPPYALAPGLFLRMPGGGQEHVVQKGDTLMLIARRYKVDFQTLASTNNKQSPYVIRVGERLRIPGSFGGGAAVAQAAPAPASKDLNSTIVIASPQAAGGQKGVSTYQPSAARRVQPPPEAEAAEPQHQAFAPQQVLPQTPPALAGRGFVWPIKGEVVAEFGPLPGKGQHNDGINIAAPRGTPVRAAENGVVAYVGNELKGFGNLLLIKHADGWMTAYAHADQLMVRKGDRVTRGQQIATVGSSGNVTSPQLHFEMRKSGEAVNPTEHLREFMAGNLQ